MTVHILYCIIGLLLLVLGGEWLVRGSVGVAQRLRLSPMVIGLTVVSFGTSAPEFIVSLQAALDGSSGIALGNVIGSNIANVALILGVTAILCPIPVAGGTLKVDTPLLLVASVLLALCCHFTHALTRLEGMVGFAIMLAYVALQVVHSRKHSTDGGSETAAGAPPKLPIALAYVLLAVIALKYGAGWLVDGASEIAHAAGVSDRVVGLTVVAIGTSLPELFASVVAARKGSVDMAVGNAIGSNLFNLLGVLSASAAISPITGISSAFAADCIWMIALTLLIWLLMRTDYRLTRTEGCLLLAVYAVYVVLAAW